MDRARLADEGRRAARKLYVDGLAGAEIDDPLDEAFAEAAVKEFGRLQREETPGIYREAIEGAEQAAKDLDIDEFHGIVEVLQNADDEGATELRLALRPRGKRRALLFAHDGGAIRLPDLVAMAVAFVSTKRDDAYKKGRFGIGLKTLRRLGSTLYVHCGPYHASIVSNQLQPAPAASPIKGFWDPRSGETLLELHLDGAVDARNLSAWLESLGASALLFLESVRSVSLARARSFEDAVCLSLKESAKESVTLRMGKLDLPCEKVRLSSDERRSWDRYLIERPVPRSAPRRSNKATGDHTPLGVAIPLASDETGLMYAGLPLGTTIGWPFRVNAQFDVDTPRTGVQRGEGGWNGWLLKRAVEAIVAIARHRFETDPAGGWVAVPLADEVEEVQDEWLRDSLKAAIPEIQRRVFRGLKFEIDGEAVSVGWLAYEARELENLLKPADIESVSWGRTPLPRSMRDSSGRFREVLEEIGESVEVGISRALDLLESEDEGLDGKGVGWFIKLAAIAIDAGCEDRLVDVASVILRDGTRVIPPAPDAEGQVLVRQVRKSSLAARLGLARPIHRSYLSRGPDALRVRRWMERDGILAEVSGDAATLRALDHRGKEGEESLELSTAELVDLRSALMALDDDEREELGPGIGAAITVDGYEFKRGKRRKMRVRPADAYLPPSLEDRREDDGWTVAVATTPGVQFVAPRYSTEIKRVRGPRPLPAAAMFFRLLGCEIAPRLEEPETETWYGLPASPIPDTLPAAQFERLGTRNVTHFRGDRLSEDLARVVSDIARDRSKRHRARRSRALLRTLTREWERLYADHQEADAVATGGRWNFRGSVPATWLAVAMDTPWLSNAKGAPCAPGDLVASTPLNRAMYGNDYEGYAAIDPELTHSAAVRALGITTDPEASGIVGQLKELRDAGPDPDRDVVASLYLALSTAVDDPDANADDLIDDLPVRQLRARFSEGIGLILTADGWKRRTEVYRGKPIFDRWRPIVPEAKGAEDLWRLLSVPIPGIGDCVSVLREVAKQPPRDEDRPTLASIYRHLETLVPAARRTDLRMLRGIPLWTGRAWTKARPIYAVDDESVAGALSGNLSVWHPPVVPSSLAGLLEPLGAELLDDDCFSALVGDDELLAGQPERATFSEAVVQLRGELAIHNQALYEALGVPWDNLIDIDLAITPTLRLELKVPGLRRLRVPAHVHLARDPLRLSCSGPERLGSRAAGRSIATLFDGGDRHVVELAWISAWTEAKAGAGQRRMYLAEEAASEEGAQEVLRRASEAVGRRVGPSTKKRTPSLDPDTTRTRGSAVRRLKSADELVIARVETPAGRATTPRGGARGLRKDLPAGEPIGTKPPSLGATKAYTPEQKEYRGLQALAAAIGGGSVELRAFNHLRGIGADALKGEEFFELKAHERDIPDHVELTLNEYRRALERGRKFYLVVVAGLEEGFETVLRIIPDPANVLEASAATGIELRGIRSVAKPIDVHFESAE